MHNYYRGLCPENRYRLLRLMKAAIVKLRGVLRREGRLTEAVVPVPCKSVPVPQSRKSPVAKWYRYHTFWYQYQHVIFEGFEQNSNSGARVRSSFDHQFEITMEKGIKAKGRVERSSF